MARDADALKIQKWAATGDVQDPEDGGLSRSVGWDATYSQLGGNLPKREHVNEILQELTALGVELNTRGLLEWDASISYKHPALVMASDGKPYISLADSTGVDPTTDTTEARWAPFRFLDVRTYEVLAANGDVGPGPGQVATGDHSH